jgi:hypothetical protein
LKVWVWRRRGIDASATLASLGDTLWSWQRMTLSVRGRSMTCFDP